MICLWWFVTFALQSRKGDSAKNVLTIFFGTCSVLYLCHTLFFNGGLPRWGETLWALCSLSVYPLYFIYITYLTCHPLRGRQMVLCLLPGLLVALAMLLFPGPYSDNARKALFAIQVFAVLYFGYRRLRTFDDELANIYADIEERGTHAVRALLIAFVAIAVLSAIANALGKEHVASSDLLLFLMATPFIILLYILGFIGWTRDFSLEQFLHDTDEPIPTLSPHQGDSLNDVEERLLGKRIEELMSEGYFLTKNLKITDLAREVGSCRTYISSYINKNYNCSFSDRINKLRIDYAKDLLQNRPELKMSMVSAMSGFTNEQSFYRNFKKFAGITPAEWLVASPDPAEGEK